MTEAEKITAWGAQKKYKVEIFSGDERISVAYLDSMPVWQENFVEDYSWTHRRDVAWLSVGKVLYQSEDFIDEELVSESGEGVTAFLDCKLEYDGTEHLYFLDEVSVYVTEVWLFGATLQWPGYVLRVSYKGVEYGSDASMNMMSLVLEAEDLNDSATIIQIGEDDEIDGHQPTAVPRTTLRAGMSISGWREVYKDGNNKYQYGATVASSAAFPLEDIPLANLRAPVFEPFFNGWQRITMRTDGTGADIPTYHDSALARASDYISQSAPIIAADDVINRFLGWRLNEVQISDSLVLDWTSPELSIIWPTISLDDELWASYSAQYCFIFIQGDDGSARIALTTPKGTLTDESGGPGIYTGFVDGEQWHLSETHNENTCRFKGWYFFRFGEDELLSTNSEVDWVCDSYQFAAESAYLYAVYELCPHVKLVVDDASWGEADIVDVAGASVLDDEGEGDLSFGRTYRFKAAIKDYGQFLGWYKPGPSYQYDDTDIVPFDDDYQNLEHLFVPQEAGDFTLIAKFDEPKRYNVVTAVTHDPSVTGGCTVSVAEGNHPSGAEAGVYFHGPLTVRGDANVGWRLVAWKINNVEVAAATEEEPCNEFLSFILGDEGTIDENDTCTVEGVFEADKFDVDLAPDEHSASKGTVSLKVSSDYGATYSDTDQRTDILAGSYLRVSVKANSGSAFRRIEVDGARIVAMPDTGDSGTYNYDFRLFKNVKVRAFFGATVTVAAKKKSSGTVSDETNGKVSASLSKTGPWNSTTCDFTYGEKVWIKAINSEVEGSTAYFNSWHSSSDVSIASVLPKYGPLIDVAATGNVTFYAKFSPQKLKVGIRITNDGDPQYGDIRVLTGGNDTYLVEVSQTTYNAVIADYFDETSTATITPYSPAGSGIDRYYVTNQGDTVRLVCEVNNADQYPFDHFGRKHYLSKTSMTSTEEDIEADEIPRFVVYANVEIFTRYQTSTPHNVIVRYATGSRRTMGSFDLAPVGVNGKMKTDALVTADYRQGNTVEVSATVKNGYKFVGWYSDAAHNTKLSGEVIYQFTMGDSEVVIFAAFAESESRVFIWEGTTENKTMTWRSRRAVLPQAMNMVVAAVHADGYPLDLKVHHASSPDPAANGWHDAEIEVKGQDARRLPIVRPGKYVEVEVVSQHAVTRVAVGSSMQGLLG